MYKKYLLVSLFFLSIFGLLFPVCVVAQPRPSEGRGQQRPVKKIVEYGWDVPYPDFIRQNIREMEKRPFEGIIFRTKGFNHAFDIRPWKQAELQPQLNTLADIKWQKFTDNFLTLYAANKWKMDWFNDDHWNTIAGAFRDEIDRS